MFETGMSALVLKICGEYAKALGLNFPPCVQQEINAIAQYVDLHTVKDLKVEQSGSVVTITCFTEGEQEKVFTVTLPDVNVDVLFNLIKGSSSVVVDKSEDGTHLVVRLDKSQEVQYVELTPASAIRGILTDTQWNILQANKGNCIIRNNEIYRLADNQSVSGLITYVHTGCDGTSRIDKSISITVSTKAWTLVMTESGGVKLYQHRISCIATFSNDDGTNTCVFSFLIISRQDTEYTLNEFAKIFNTYGSSFITLSTIYLPETGDMPLNGLGMVVFSEPADVLEVRAYYYDSASVKEYHSTGSASDVGSLTDTVTEL